MSNHTPRAAFETLDVLAGNGGKFIDGHINQQTVSEQFITITQFDVNDYASHMSVYPVYDGDFFCLNPIYLFEDGPWMSCVSDGQVDMRERTLQEWIDNFNKSPSLPRKHASLVSIVAH